jgi:histidinol-phosphate aminotransferase
VRSRALAASELPFLGAGLQRLGARVVPSQANFLFADFPGRPAPQLFEALLRRGVVVRPMHGYGFPTAQRITVGLRGENEKLLAALAEALAG